MEGNEMLEMISGTTADDGERKTIGRREALSTSGGGGWRGKQLINES